MNIAIVMLARLGDILQTFPALQGLRKKFPQAKLHLIVRETFADAARVYPHVDNLIVFPSQKILGAPSRDHRLKNLEEWLKSSLLSHEFDLVINLTFSPASAYLSALLKSNEYRGIIADSHGNYAIADSWSQYFFAQVLEKNLNIIHLNDLFIRIADVRNQECWPVEIIPFIRNQPKNKMRIGIQTTASTLEKTLNLKNWATIAEKLLQANDSYELIFFGSKNDSSWIQNIISQLPNDLQSRTRSIAGIHRFHENLNDVASCHWIITPDTAMVHLASLAQVQTIQICLGSTISEETGPYGADHYVLYPLDSNIDYLANAIKLITQNNKLDIQRTAYSKTKFTNCVDGSKRNELIPINFIGEESKHFFSQAYYALAEFRCAGLQEDLEIPRLGASKQPQSIERITQAYDSMCSIRRASEFGEHYCFEMLDRLAANQTSEIDALMTKLNEIETLLSNLKKAVPLVKPLIDSWIIAKDVAYIPSINANKNDLSRENLSNTVSQVLETNISAYKELGQNVEIVQQLLKIAVDAANALNNKSDDSKKKNRARLTPNDKARKMNHENNPN